MDEPTEKQNNSPPATTKENTTTERHLAKLCRDSFLSLWSYPSPYRDQGRHGGKGDGKELCDVLVVFENHIFIFSDKDCEFLDSGNLVVDWGRWYRRAVRQSAEQVFGAERWIRRFPKNLFLDRQCSVPFPIELPSAENAIFHRIVVAHDGARKCREALGGSGSLMLDTAIHGDAHLEKPFTIGLVDTSRGFVHVFDDTTLHILMTQLDTITDFTGYLTKKERFLTSGRRVAAAGEEELLATFLEKLDGSGDHDFLIPANYNAIYLAEGLWESFVNSSQHRAQVEADEISYGWDTLIEEFLHHAMSRTQYFGGETPLIEQEKAFRFLAREPRTRRRFLASSLRDVVARSVTSRSTWDARIIVPSRNGDPHYVILCVRHPSDISDEEYRQRRLNMLRCYCEVTKLEHKGAQIIIGIATESGLGKRRSEDFAYLDTSKWSSKDEARAKEIQKRLGILKQTKMSKGIEYEFPTEQTQAGPAKIPSRNSPCKCGSGKRYRKCHGKDFYPKKKKKDDGNDAVT